MYYQMGSDEWDWTLPRDNGRMPATPPAPEPTTPLARRRAARMSAM
jgi:hypothetical protein